MGEWKIAVALRMRGDLRAEMIALAEHEKRSLGNLAAILLEWSFEQLKAAGSTTKLLGRSAKRLQFQYRVLSGSARVNQRTRTQKHS